MSNKVKCNLCMFENKKYCMKKKTSINTTKNRCCDLYIESADKFEMMMIRKNKQAYPEITTRPDHVWDGKNVREWDGTRYIKVRDKAKESILKASMGIVDTDTKTTKNDAHPLTGDLSKFFKSTVN